MRLNFLRICDLYPISQCVFGPAGAAFPSIP